MARNHDFGRRCEDLAAAHLEARGWRILERNARDGPREVDIIAERDGTIAFIEVKGRARADRGHPLEAIGHAKRRDLARAARAWIARHGHRTGAYRFDAVSVTLAPRRIEHRPDAWRLD
jgi:putative endonuclease